MKSKKKIKKDKDFDTVKTFRAIKEQVSRDVKDMSYEQLREYLSKARLEAGNS